LLGSFAGNEQVPNFLRPTQPPTLSGRKLLIDDALCGECLMWLIGAVVCLMAAPRSLSAGNTMRCDTCSVTTTGSCQSAATEEIVKH